MCLVIKLDYLSYIFLGLLHGEMKKDLFSLTFRICFNDQFQIPEICLEDNYFAVGKTYHDVSAEK